MRESADSAFLLRPPIEYINTGIQYSHKKLNSFEKTIAFA